MSNRYLEKIALSVEDATTARKAGDKAFRKTEAKAAIGTGAIAGGLTYAANKKYSESLSRVVRMTPKKIRGALAGYGAVVGAIAGSAGSQPIATSNKNKAHLASLNKSLQKKAEVTLQKVKKRNEKNQESRDLHAALGSTVGFAGGAAAVGGAALHSGMRSGGGYSAIRQKVKNDFAARKNSKNLGGGATLMGKEHSVVPHIDGRAIGNKVGSRFGQIVRKAGLLGSIGGALVGAKLATNSANKKLDKADAEYYTKAGAK